MGTVGVPELVMMLAIAALWIVPVAATVWGLFTLHRIRTGQDALRLTVEALERSLQQTRRN